MSVEALSSVLVLRFGELAERLGAQTRQDLIRASLHAATCIQLQSLLAILPHLAARKKSERQLLGLLEKAARSSVNGFFSDLQESQIPFPPDLRVSLDDVFRSGLGAMLQNATLMYNYDTSYWEPPQATDPQGQSRPGPAKRKKGRSK
jgi:hypothetical protein